MSYTIRHLSKLLILTLPDLIKNADFPQRNMQTITKHNYFPHTTFLPFQINPFFVSFLLSTATGFVLYL